MVKFFTYDSMHNRVEVNTPEIFLVKEFADLWTNERNACDEDPTGDKKLRGFKELVYIYLAIDWGAPGANDTPKNRHLLAMESSGLTEEEYNDEVFRAACRKYRELQDTSSLTGKLVESYTNAVHKIRVFIDNIDYTLTKEDGTPIYKTKDTLTEMAYLDKAMDALESMKDRYRKEQEEDFGLRGDSEPGALD